MAAVHPDDLRSFSISGGRRFDTASRWSMTLRFRRRDGEYRWLLLVAVSLRDTHGNVTKWYGVATDIEDRKRAEEERERLRQLEADLAHINRVSMMGELTASIAHEVNQPLTGIVSNGSACLRWLAGDAPNVRKSREVGRRHRPRREASR